MKAKMEANCVERESRLKVAMLVDGSIHKKTHKKTKSLTVHENKREENTEEIKEYLGKLQELVPFMPKNKRLSKLEVISHVIDYIHDLRETLGLPPCPQDVMESSDEDDHSMEDQTELVSNQTFKLSLVKGSSTMVSTCDIKSSPLPRPPLSSISTPRNSENSDTPSNEDGISSHHST